ncbi:MAG: 3-deoxy-D-manno-octulosonic acid transferase [Rhodospirillaceae bacterium]|jgi:3-deoxy-D-manno-octulosonic-acid transferase|nr:3-deoxy-D-manno-octulosonic acid transferase [Rhodospirillaceae bacterium]
MMLSLYRLTTILGAPLIHYFLNRRKARGKEDPARFGERLGSTEKPRPEGPLYWLHAASVGESLSLLPLIDKLLADRPNCHLLMTTGTVTSAKLMQERLPERAFHQYIPVDRPSYVRRFLDHWRPDISLWAESDFWPNMITEAQSRNIPMVLVNGRISANSFAGWQRARSLIRALLQGFTLCLGQSQEDVDRLVLLGSRHTKNLGNLKFAVPALPVDDQEFASLKTLIGERPCWLAASTHPGEEEIIAEVHKQLKNTHSDLLTVIVPRHPTRGEDIAEALQRLDVRLALRSTNSPLTADTDIYIADTMGELGLFFRLTDIVFMGKSLVPLGGQNPLEALRLECAVIHGPHMANFQWMSEQMLSDGCSLQVNNAEELSNAVTQLLMDVAKKDQMIRQGNAFVDSQSQVTERVAQEIETILDHHLAADKNAAA